MSGDNFTSKPRAALGDVTNLPAKGVFSLISGDLGLKSRDGYGKNVDSVNGDSVHTSSGPCTKDSDDEGKFTSNVMLINPVGQALVGGASANDDNDSGVGSLARERCGPVEWSRLPTSQGLKSFESEKCTTLKGDVCANLNAGADMLKACSCSFCLKAACIWSDLYYQDIKGRQSALRKSQKEAGILVNKYARGKQADIHSQVNSNKSLKLVSDLTDLWRSHFRHMEDMFANESSQLQQAGYVTLKDLRDSCKMDLEMITGMPSDTL